MSILGKVGLTTVAGATGAAAAYILDPQQGRRRRAQAKDMLLARARKTARDADSHARYVAGTATGTAKRFTGSGSGNSELEDTALVRKVESVIFRPEDAPKGRVSVNGEGSVIFLRGEVETQEQIDALIHGAEGVAGVEQVRNLLHLPGQPAPSSDSATAGA